MADLFFKAPKTEVDIGADVMERRTTASAVANIFILTFGFNVADTEGLIRVFDPPVQVATDVRAVTDIVELADEAAYDAEKPNFPG